MALEHMAAHLPREVRYGDAACIAIPLRLVDENGQEVTFASGDSVAVAEYSPDGAVLTSGGLAAGLVTGTAKVTLTWDASDIGVYALDEGYRARLTITDASATRDYVRELTFDVVRRPFLPEVSSDHFPPQLRPPPGESDFSRLIQTAYAEFISWLRATVQLDQRAGDAWRVYWGDPSPRGYLNAQPRLVRTRPALVYSTHDAQECLRHWALKLAYREAMLRAGDVFATQHDLAARDLADALRRLVVSMRYDADEDGRADAGEDRATFGSFALTR